MEPQLLQFFQGHNSADLRTHSTFFGPAGTYGIGDRDWVDFWILYCRLIHQYQQNSVNDSALLPKIPVGEIIGTHLPLIIKMNLKFRLSSEDQPIDQVTPTEAFILDFVRVVQNVICRMYQSSAVWSELACVRCSQENPIINDRNVTFNYLFYFPYCRLSKESIRRYFREGLLNSIRHANLFTHLLVQPVNNWEEILPDITLETAIPLYGSIIKSGDQPYLLDGCLARIEEDDIDGAKDGVEYDYSPLVDLFNFQAYSRVSNQTFPLSTFYLPEILVELGIDPENYDQITGIPILSPNDNEKLRAFWLPIFLSIEFWSAITVPRDDGDPTRIHVSLPSRKTHHISVTEHGNIEDLELKIAIQLLPLIDVKRLNNPSYAIIIGKAIYNVTNKGFSEEASAEGLNLWKDVMKRGKGLTPEECERHYYSFRSNNPYTFKTLAVMALTDSPAEYSAWHSEFIRPYIEGAASCENNSVAHALYWCYFTNFICSDIEKKKWYKYDGTKWVRMDGACDLRVRMSGHFCKLIQALRTNLSRRIEQLDDFSERNKAEKERLTIMIGKCNNLCRKLLNRGFKSSTIDESMEFFHEPSFENLKDSLRHLTAVRNGVLDAGPRSCQFRPGLPEEYLTMTSNTYYPTDGSWDHEKVKIIMKWLKQCYAQVTLNALGQQSYEPKATQEVVEYILKLWASGLQGRNAHKLLLILTGFGNNSKSMLKKIHKYIFGQYCRDLDIGVINGSGKNGSGPNPALAMLNRVKEAWISEPSTEETLMDGLIKLLTGGDSFFARLLNENGGDIEAACMVYLMCNKIPGITPSRAMKNRIRIIEHPGNWCSDAPADEMEQLNQRKYPDDPFFENSLEGLAPYLLWILVEKFVDYRRDGIRQPQVVTDATEKFWAENDLYAIFIKEYCRLAVVPGSITPENPQGIIDSNSTVSKSELYDAFKSFYMNAYPNTPVPQRSSLIYEMEQRIGKIALDERWHGMFLDGGMSGLRAGRT